MIDPDTPLAEVLTNGREATALGKAFRLATIDDALRFYPRKYLRRGVLTPLSELRIDDEVTVLARVKKLSGRQARRTAGGKPRWITELVITDGHGEMVVTLFNQRWRERHLGVGTMGLFSGTVGTYRGRRQLVHPEVVPLANDDTDIEDVEVVRFAGQLLPIYPGTASMRSTRTARALGGLLPRADDLADPLPAAVREEHGLLGLADALRAVHAPNEMADVAEGQRRLRFEEAFVLQAELMRRRAERRAMSAVPRQLSSAGLVAALERRLPFELTDGQRAVGDEIAADMARDYPMLRLLQGDVGSGKTVVALRAMLATVDAGAQAALLAPTEVLAGQHYATIMDILGPLGRRGQLSGDAGGTSVVLLTGSMSTREKRRALSEIASGAAGIVVGTHALMSQQVMFADLGLVVVDEQHKFGVEQRAALLAKAAGDAQPHMLVMTATPIPRTVAMTVFGDLDVSTLSERPATRAGVTTHVVPATARPAHLARAWRRAAEEVERGHQVYIVCPRITLEDSAAAAEQDEALPPVDPEALLVPEDTPPPAGPGLGATAVTELAAELAAGPLADCRVGVMHGRLAPDDKDAVMAAFAAGPGSGEGIDVLVSTTVVEVGVDVPGATLMIICEAERFGLSSLHQLRGRVGRGDQPGLCLLVTDAEPGSAAYERLERLAATEDGFEISRIDAELRREGDVLGASQSGIANSLRLLSVIRHEDVIRAARASAEAVFAADPELGGEPALAAALDRLAARAEADFMEKA